MDNNKDKREWPITPKFLSLRKDCFEYKANYNTDGIYYTDYIRGFLADLSHDKNIQNALSIFQFVPKNFLPHDPNAENSDIITTDPEKGTVILNEPLDPKIKEILDKQKKKIIRIDSGTFMNNGRLCDAFRKQHPEKAGPCFMQDSIVGIFASEELNKLKSFTEENEYRKRLDDIIKEFNQNRVTINKIKLDEVESSSGIKRLYIHYTCPHSYFEEHVFPIYVQERVIACLMFGQMARDAFNKDNPFPQYWDKMIEKHEKCHEYLKEIENLDTDKWKKKAQAIVNRIEIFEERLEDRIDHRNTRYINKAFTEIEQKFRDDVKRIVIKKTNALKQFTEALNRAFFTIKKKFDHSEDGFIRMFAQPIDIKHDELVPIGWSGAEFEANNDFSFTLYSLNDIDKVEEREREKRILEAASQKINKQFDKNSGDLFLPGWLVGNEVAYIVWKRHDEELKKQEKIFETYKHALRTFYTVALEYYSYIRGVKMELLLETTIQEAAHESAHFILPAIDVVENHLEVIPKEMVSPKYRDRYESIIDSYEKYKAEVLESLHQLREINYGSSLILSPDLQIYKSQEEVFDLLYKLKKTLNNRALESHKSIYYHQSEHYVRANIDKKYLDHALYNLLDNAIKYGYEGSYIWIKMDVDRTNDMLKIEVVSYGIEIEPDEKIYQLFERSKEAEKKAGGTGIGLYIVKKICKAHGGDITHRSEKISDLNIPVLFNYKPRNTLANKNSLGEIDSFEKELSKLSGSIENEVVYDPRFVSYAQVFKSRINEPTYRNTFCIIIPLS